MSVLRHLVSGNRNIKYPTNAELPYSIFKYLPRQSDEDIRWNHLCSTLLMCIILIKLLSFYFLK